MGNRKAPPPPTNRRKPAPPPAPPAWRNPNELVRDFGRSPVERCPKCGAKDGWSRPKYGSTIDVQAHGRCLVPSRREFLDVSCRGCGYTRRLPTFDAERTAPPPPDPSLDPGWPPAPPNTASPPRSLWRQILTWARGTHP
jgi:predicted nucleic-acid-binding Zn-ribbon protein